MTGSLSCVAAFNVVRSKPLIKPEQEETIRSLLDAVRPDLSAVIAEVICLQMQQRQGVAMAALFDNSTPYMVFGFSLEDRRVYSVDYTKSRILADRYFYRKLDRMGL